ncbi:TRAF3-interacting protein 1 isoform X1 [Photinus pyralis]|uniref:TRAF3-interacting protein 1 isoform X1 n=1 Tax=Photinus pyralis TaxID=7054 RepID=UPI00126764BF|nr:TRAF3-interacting protein 1 isoform X1 [Photinus pyralis]
MSSEIDIQVIQNTQDVLGKYIKKPALTEKLLRKPPFRFLHDVITNVVRETGFLKGLYSERELVSENVKEKDDKIAFLNKVIEATKVITGMDLAVRPSKVIAGFEPNETNLLLQAIGSALDKQLSSSEYINQLNAKKQGTKESEKKPKPSKSKEKNLKNSKEKENTTKTSKLPVNQKTPDTKLGNKKSSNKGSKIPVGTEPKPGKMVKSKGNLVLPDDNGTVKKSSLSQMNFENESRPIVENVPSLATRTGTDETTPKLTNSDVVDHSTVAIEETKNVSDENNQFTLPETADAFEIGNVKETEASIFKEIEIKPKLPISRPKSSLRPPSARPSSARPGAPRLQRSDSMLIKEKEVLPLGKVEIIDENSSNTYIDEEETVTIEATPEVEYQAPVLDLPTDKGHLVEQILQQINSSDVEPIKSNVNVEWEQAGMRNRNSALKEVDQLKGAIQDLTKMVNPLGKLINYLHEDIEAMYSELDMWNNSVRQIMIDVVNQKKKRDESNVPLQMKLNEIEENIVKHQQQIISTYSNIMRNEERIQDLLVK